MPTIIRMVANIPLSAIPPGATDPVTMSDDERSVAINAAASMVDQIYAYSDGMAEVEMDIVLVRGPVTADQYSDRGDGQMYLSGAKMAILVGNREHYDFPCTYATPAQMPTVQTFRGIASSGAYMGKLMSGCNLTVGPHELAHLLEQDIRAQGYTNFPACSDNTNGAQSIHCGPTYGYPTNLEIEFYEQWYTGTLPDGTGVNQTGWNVPTKTARGEKSVVPLRVPRVATDHERFAVRRSP